MYASSSKPFPPDPYIEEETHQLTFRSLLIGSLLGCVVGASNIYLGLKTGFTFGAQLFGVSDLGCCLLRIALIPISLSLGYFRFRHLEVDLQGHS